MYIIDRFEGEWVVIEAEHRKTFRLPVSLVPAKAKEGDVLKISVKIDFDTTEKLSAEVSKLTRSIFKD